MQAEQYHCPKCGAEIEPDLIGSTGSDDCPFCGADVSDLLPDQSTEDIHSSIPDAYTSNRSSGSLAGSATSGTLPEKSEIQILEDSPDRLLLHIPPGKGSKGLGCFVFLWNIITFGVAGGFLMEFNWNNIDVLQLLGGLAFFSIFMLVGLGIGYWWLKLKYTRVNLLVEPGHVAVQKIFFSNKKMTDITLTDTSRAELVESYSENDNPVYEVCIEGEGDQKAKFGVSLRSEEKDWLVETINKSLGINPQSALAAATISIPDRCPNCDASLENVTMNTKTKQMVCPECDHLLAEKPSVSDASIQYDFEQVNPETVTPAGSMVIHEATRSTLDFSYPIVKQASFQTGCSCVVSSFGLVWLLMFGFFVGGKFFGGGNPFQLGNLFSLIFAIAFCFPGLVILLAGRAIKRGRIFVRLDEQELRVNWGWRKIGIKRSTPIERITAVKIMKGHNVRKTTNRRHRGQGNEVPSSFDVPMCLVETSGKPLLLTTTHDLDLVKQVAGMLTYQLYELGHRTNEPS